VIQRGAETQSTFATHVRGATARCTFAAHVRAPARHAAGCACSMQSHVCGVWSHVSVRLRNAWQGSAPQRVAGLQRGVDDADAVQLGLERCARRLRSVGVARRRARLGRRHRQLVRCINVLYRLQSTRSDLLQAPVAQPAHSHALLSAARQRGAVRHAPRARGRRCC
jgi:hypothetical protein